MNIRLRNVFLLALDVAIIFCALWVYLPVFQGTFQGMFIDKTIPYFQNTEFDTFTFKIAFYFMGLSIIDIPFAIIGLVNPKKDIPNLIGYMKTIGFVYHALMLFTCVCGFFYLWITSHNPGEALSKCFGGNCIFTHLIIPLLCIIQTVLFVKFAKPTNKYFIFLYIPLLTYAIQYFVCVFGFKNWIDFYQLQNIAKNITIFGLIGGILLLIILIFLLGKLAIKVSGKNKE